MFANKNPDREKIEVARHAFCILGDERVFHARSAAMFTAVMRNAYLKGAYVPYQVEPAKLGEAMKALNVLNMAGANVTSPYKETAMSWMDELSEAAQIIGSINTIIIKKERRKGYNTNAIGITHALRQFDFKPADKPAVVLGAGGAARAVLFVLNWLKADPIYIAGRNLSKIRKMTQKLGGQAIGLSDLEKVVQDAKLIVNATSVSSADEAPELAKTVIRLLPKRCELIFDLNYDKPDNVWQDLAQLRDIPFMDGLLALAHQGSQTLALWTGTTINPKKFMEALSIT